VALSGVAASCVYASKMSILPVPWKTRKASKRWATVVFSMKTLFNEIIKRMRGRGEEIYNLYSLGTD